ncbi:MAG: hypothetical protein CO098_13515 [Bacteroidetes bacterium CG_4_9_14_3_um_filter_41_19]|nr:MAG: hypothetical protein CO098_13515 [Bacteroidetes bacterium CG_4_9_14_3_um_filter_41_19]
MIIEKNSILYNLPKELGIKDLLILDSIRFTIELIDLNYSLLLKELENVSQNFSTSDNKYEKNLIPIFNSCWSIIDNTQRLQKQYRLLPSNDNHNLVHDLSIITPLRNTFQHMDERIEECLIEGEMPFYGVISWEIKLNEGSMMNKFFAISGLYVPRGKLAFKVVKKEIPVNEIMDVRLSTFVKEGKKPDFEFVKKEICISDLFAKIKSIIEKFESNLNNQFIKQNVTNTDWIKLRDVLLKVEF